MFSILAEVIGRHVQYNICIAAMTLFVVTVLPGKTLCLVFSRLTLIHVTWAG